MPRDKVFKVTKKAKGGAKRKIQRSGSSVSASSVGTGGDDSVSANSTQSGSNRSHLSTSAHSNLSTSAQRRTEALRRSSNFSFNQALPATIGTGTRSRASRRSSDASSNSVSSQVSALAHGTAAMTVDDVDDQQPTFVDVSFESVDQSEVSGINVSADSIDMDLDDDDDDEPVPPIAKRVDPRDFWESDSDSEGDEEDERREDELEDALDLLPNDEQLELALNERCDVPPFDFEVTRRLAIAYVFVNVLHVPAEVEWPDGNEFSGNYPIMAFIKNTLDIPKGTDIKYVLRDILDCVASRREYNGLRRALGTTRPPIIDKDDVEAQIIADEIEAGSSLIQATRTVNEHRKENDLEPLSLSAVYGLSLRLEGEVKPIRKTKQGSADANSNWAKARHRWCLQLLKRMGLDDDPRYKPEYNDLTTCSRMKTVPLLSASMMPSYSLTSTRST